MIKNNCDKFTDNQVEKIINWIERRKYYIHHEIEDDKEKIEIAKAYGKKEWLSSLEKLNDQRVKKLFEKYDKINDHPVEHPGFNSWTGPMQHGDISPIEKEEFTAKSNKEIAYIISRSVRTVEFHRGHIMRKFNAGSLAELIKKASSLDFVDK